MFYAVFFFLGVAGFILAATVCLSAGKRAADRTTAARGKEPTLNERVKWQEMEPIWMVWYAQCRENAIKKQKAIYSWVRTLALCAALCLLGIVLNVELDEQASGPESGPVSHTRTWQRVTRRSPSHLAACQFQRPIAVRKNSGCGLLDLTDSPCPSSQFGETARIPTGTEQSTTQPCPSCFDIASSATLPIVKYSEYVSVRQFQRPVRFAKSFRLATRRFHQPDHHSAEACRHAA